MKKKRFFLVIVMSVLCAALLLYARCLLSSNDKRKDGLFVEDLGDGVTLTLIRIPPGKFTMGSPIDEPGRFTDESPEHAVSISRAIWMGKFEVTQEQYQKIMRMSPSRFRGRKRPVETITFFNAREFCQKLSQKTGKLYRLPTEAEWEYACRAGTNTALYTGLISINGIKNSPEIDPIAWYAGNSGVANEDGIDSSAWEGKQYPHRRAATHPVGFKKPNDFGLYDMIGNVWEWCQDWYDAGYYQATPYDDPSGPQTSAKKVLRGGSWGSDVRNCRSANRLGEFPGQRNHTVGLRVVLENAAF